MDTALLPLLPSLVALVEEGGVRRAAQRMGVSQPRMSARLAMLRTLLEDPLLVQASGFRGLVATDRGRSLAASARSMLNELEAAFAARDFDSATADRTFAIMANDNAAAIVGLTLFARVRDASGPCVRLSLQQFSRARLSDLETGELDLALGTPGHFERMPALMTRTIMRDRFASAVRHGDPPVEDMDDYCARDHVLVSGDGGGFDGFVDRALADKGRKRRVALSVQSYLLAIEAVASSDMVATLPRALLASSHRGLTVFDPPLSLPPFSLAAAWHPRVDADKAHGWLRGQLDMPT